MAIHIASSLKQQSVSSSVCDNMEELDILLLWPDVLNATLCN